MKTQKPPLMFILFLLVVLVSVVPGCISADQSKPVQQPKVSIPTPRRGEQIQQPSAPTSITDSAKRTNTPESVANKGLAIQAKPQPAPLPIIDLRQQPNMGSYQVPLTPGNSSTELEKGSSPRRAEAIPKELTPEQKVRTIQQALDGLPEGKFFHNVPPEMRVGQPVTIEAGITKDITEQLLNELQGQGVVESRSGVRYDPMGIDIELSADKSDFNVQPISVGKHPPIVDGKATIWRWQVTPLKRDRRYITLIATVQLQVPELERNYKREYVVYGEPVMVEGRLGYSLQQLITRHWQNFLIGLLALGLGVFAWFFALKPRKRSPIEKIDG